MLKIGFSFIPKRIKIHLCLYWCLICGLISVFMCKRKWKCVSGTLLAEERGLAAFFITFSPLSKYPVYRCRRERHRYAAPQPSESGGALIFSTTATIKHYYQCDILKRLVGSWDRFCHSAFTLENCWVSHFLSIVLLNVVSLDVRNSREGALVSSYWQSKAVSSFILNTCGWENRCK